MQQDHIASIFKEYSTPSRVLRSFTNLSNTVIETALSGQSKFVFEILQNADDAFEESTETVMIHFILHDDYLIVHHNGKKFHYNDVERICDYASQVEEVKATDLSKTGYKGLGFKSLFNLSDCIYVYSNGYSFRFDKSYWSDPQSKPWQIIPIWCEYSQLPLHNVYLYDQPVNFILKINDVSRIETQLREVVEQPDQLLYLHRINKLDVILNGKVFSLERKVEKFELFTKVNFYENNDLKSTWILKAYNRIIPGDLQKLIQGASKFTFPDKIKKAKQVDFTFALRSDETLKTISKIRGMCYSTLPTQLCITLPYHVNSFFVLNLDRTQLHENEWNEFLVYQIGQLQLSLLKHLAEIPYLNVYVIELLVREINHPYNTFSKAFSKGFNEVKFKIGWIPAREKPKLLKLGEAWTDDIDFFEQNFENVQDIDICPNLISYDVKGQKNLSTDRGEVKRFTYDHLFQNFRSKYYPQLTRRSHIEFISYLYERLRYCYSGDSVMVQLKSVPFLVSKDGALVRPENALIEESGNHIPDFANLNPVDNECLPRSSTDLIKNWLTQLGARWLRTPNDVIRVTILEWIRSGTFRSNITSNNHMEIINYLAQHYVELNKIETETIKNHLLIRTESNKFKQPNLCYFPDVIPLKEFGNIISNDEKISSLYDMRSLRVFFMDMGVHDTVTPIDYFRKGILIWIKNGEIKRRVTLSNYSSIIQLVASIYFKTQDSLTGSEETELEKFPVLTCDQTFQIAKNCYFVYEHSHVKKVEYLIERNILVSADGISCSVKAFLLKIGVSEKLQPVEVLRRSVLKWIDEGTINSRITTDNHSSILEYIAETWIKFKISSELSLKDRELLKNIPILTSDNTFRAACYCCWPLPKEISTKEDSRTANIPGLDQVISPHQFISSEYSLDVLKGLFKDLGVHDVEFKDIYEKYIDNLTECENVKWFFSHLSVHWGRNSSSKNDEVLSYIQGKFKSLPCLLSRNGNKYPSTELYSSQFDAMHKIDPNSVPVLAHEKLSKGLEEWLGFRMDLDLTCIMKLLKAIQDKSDLGNKEFFTTMLEQLRRRNKDDIKKYQLSLLSQENKLKPAKDLYYFEEEEATCILDHCYLKRIPGMSHKDTLELAGLCGVNILPFDETVDAENETLDDTLMQFYVERLPFIVFQVSRELNELPEKTLKRLYEKICSIKLYQCENIYIQYPFGDPTRIRNHFQGLTLYVIGEWTSYKHKSKIRNYINERLRFKPDIWEIIDMDLQKDKQSWIEELENEDDRKRFYQIEDEVKKLLSQQGKVCTITSEDNLGFDQTHISENEEKRSLNHELENKELVPTEYFANESFVENEPNLHIHHAIKSEEIAIVESCSDKSSVSFVEAEPTLPICHVIKAEDTTIAESFSGESSVSFVKDEPNTQILCSVKVKEFIGGESSSHESSLGFVEEVLAQSNIEDNCFARKSEIITRSKIPTGFVDSISKDIIEVDVTWLVSREEDYNNKIMQRSETSGSNHSSTDSHHFESSEILQGIRKKNDVKWLSERYAFTFLQDYYKNKHPNSEFNLLDGLFTLQWRSHKIEIIWLNENEERVRPYDLMLKIDGRVKRRIDVKLLNAGNNDLKGIGHRTFVEKINQLATWELCCKEKCDKFCANWLSEKHVFTFLQDYYKNKYPNSQFSLLEGLFTLQWQSHMIEIIWLHGTKEKEHPYDLLLKKNGEVKSLIEVKSTVLENDKSFRMNHHKCMEKVRALTKEFPEYKDKYCIYHLVYTDNISVTKSEELINVSALYKVMPLKYS